MNYQINLLPTDLVRPPLMGGVSWQHVLLAGVGVVLLGSYALFLGFYFGTRAELKKLERELATLQPGVEQVKMIRRERESAEKNLEAWRQVIQQRQTWSGFLNDLNSALPVDTWLTRVSISAAGKEEKGLDAPAGSGGGAAGSAAPPVAPPKADAVVIEGASLTPPSVGVFLNNLYHLPYFEDLRLEECTLVRDGSFTFKIVGEKGVSR